MKAAAAALVLLGSVSAACAADPGRPRDRYTITEPDAPQGPMKFGPRCWESFSFFRAYANQLFCAERPVRAAETIEDIEALRTLKVPTRVPYPEVRRD